VTNDDQVTAEIHGFSQPGAEPTPWPAALERIAAAETFWDYSVRDGAFDCRPPTREGAVVRAIVFRLRPARGLGFRKGDDFSQTTWRFPSAGR
jgi:hypothetical protein